jgi:hypothetical protein
LDFPSVKALQNAIQISCREFKSPVLVSRGLRGIVTREEAVKILQGLQINERQRMQTQSAAVP